MFGWFRKRRSATAVNGPRRSANSRPQAVRLQVEALEDRVVPTGGLAAPFFTAPYAGTLYLKPLGGDAAATTEFGTAQTIADDFNAGAINSNLWQVGGTGSTVVKNGQLDMMLTGATATPLSANLNLRPAVHGDFV